MLPGRFQFRHFQSRLLVFLLVPLIAVLASVYLAVTRANTANAMTVITGDLQRGAVSFSAAIESRNLNLAIAGDALSRDYAFKEVYSTRDHPTILSAMDNMLGRLISADFMALVREEDNLLVADTRNPELAGVVPQWLHLIDEARALDRRGAYPEAADVLVLDGRPYHLTVLPFGSPNLEAWIGLGFEINQGFTDEFRDSIAADVSVLFLADQQWQLNGSTLQVGKQQELLTVFNSRTAGNLDSILTLGSEEFVTLAHPLSNDGSSVQVVLQRSLPAQLAPFLSLRQTLFTIFAFGLIALALVLIAISRNVTRPVLLLAQGAGRIASGDYRQLPDLAQQDEIGTLTQAFNGMARGLAEKEKVRDLLGKVVSPEIAAELLSRDIELGGEEREVTVLFADLRGFTSLCEGQSPQAILGLLNEYFSALTAAIEAQGGVVDKYIGDAVMALFGAPVTRSDAPAGAIRAALAMYEALEQLNATFVARGRHPVSIGVGINTDKVVAGNMGSRSRLNYTVIGDGVNLASRLEGLTKRYGANIIVSEACCKAAPQFLYLELDQVRVKGRQEPVRIFEPLCALADAQGELAELPGQFQNFLQAYRAGDFSIAVSLLDTFSETSGGKRNPVLVNLYRSRLQQLAGAPPLHWDGVHTFTDK